MRAGGLLVLQNRSFEQRAKRREKSRVRDALRMHLLPVTCATGQPMSVVRRAVASAGARSHAATGASSGRTRAYATLLGGAAHRAGVSTFAEVLLASAAAWG